MSSNVVKFARRQTFYFKYTNELLNHVAICHSYNRQIMTTTTTTITDHPLSEVEYNFIRVCLSVCQTITFESFVVGSSFLHIRYTSRRYARRYASNSHIKVIRSRSRSQKQKGRKCLFPQSRNDPLRLAISSVLPRLRHRPRVACSPP